MNSMTTKNQDKHGGGSAGSENASGDSRVPSSEGKATIEKITNEGQGLHSAGAVASANDPYIHKIGKFNENINGSNAGTRKDKCVVKFVNKQSIPQGKDGIPISTPVSNDNSTQGAAN